jgi:AbrB family looped-hinge helix DNA binding protein
MELANASVKIFSLQVQKQGQIVIPKDVLNSLQVNEGQTLNLLQIGELVLLVPKQPQETSLAKSFISLMAVNNVSLNDLVEGLQQERQAIWQERQGRA